MILAFKEQFVNPILEGTKIHTIREDKTNRWRYNKPIQMATGVRTKQYKCFKQAICTSTQRVFMTYDSGDIIEISINGKELFTPQEKLEFAINDGFKTWREFFDWFYPLIISDPDQQFIGKVIHWTDKRY